MKEKLKQYLCNNCKMDDAIICTATKSGLRGCNKGALTLEKATEKKRSADERWRNYLK
ncbi:MAG: hypothetical protein V3V84_03085 [Candidatus Bathyarchaeia archaeon]